MGIAFVIGVLEMSQIFETKYMRVVNVISNWGCELKVMAQKKIECQSCLISNY